MLRPEGVGVRVSAVGRVLDDEVSATRAGGKRDHGGEVDELVVSGNVTLLVEREVEQAEGVVAVAHGMAFSHAE